MRLLQLVLFCFPLLISAQSTGKISYLQTQQVNFTPRPGMPQEVIDRIPKERKNTKVLYFNDSESLYKNGKALIEEVNDVADERERRMRRRMMGRRDSGESYKNLTSGQIVDKRDIFGKEFLVTDDIMKYQWKITGQKKDILDYVAMEAKTIVDDSIHITAWFTPHIPIQNGPSRFGGLPGLILEIDMNNGDNIIVATDIELGELDSSITIAEPKKGKTVTREEFNKITKEKREEMREQGGGRNRGGFGGRRGGRGN